MTQKANIDIKVDNKQGKQAMMDMARSTRAAARQMEQDFANLKSVAQKTGIALIGVGAAGTAVIAKSTLLAARVQTLQVVLHQVGKTAGYTAMQMDDFEEAVKRQGITTQAARVSLVRLVQANIDLSHASTLARVAQDAAVVAGINSSQAFERMIWGINTLNPRILKTMGLTVSLQGAYTKYAQEVGKTVGEISMQEKKQLALNEVLKAGVAIQGTYEAAMTTAGKKLTSLPRFVEEASLAIGVHFTEALGLAIDKTTDFLKGFIAMEEGIQRFTSYLIAGESALVGVTGAALVFLPQILNIGRALITVKDVMLTTGIVSKVMGSSMWLAAAGTTGLTGALTGLLMVSGVGIVLAGLVAIIAALAAESKKQKKAAEEERQSLQKLADQAGTTADSYEDYSAAVDRLAEKNGYAVRSGDELARSGEAVQASYMDLRMGIAHVDDGMIVFNKTIEKQTRLQWDLVRLGPAIETWSQGYYNDMAAMREASEETSISLEDLQQANEEAAQAAAEAWDRASSGISYIMGVNLVQATEDHEERMIDLQETYLDINGELDALTEKYTRWYGSMDNFPTSVQEEIANLEDQLGNAKEAIDKETEAWSRSNREMLFNMSIRALELALAEDTTLSAEDKAERMFGAMSVMAEGLDLIDPAEAQLWRDMGEAMATYVTDGKLETMEDTVLGIGEAHGILETDIAPIPTIIEAMASAWARVPRSVTTVYKIINQTGEDISGLDFDGDGGGGGGGGGGRSGGGRSGGGGVPRGRQHGGFWSGRGTIAVGEIGEEWLVPINGGYIILTAEQVRKAKAQGGQATEGMQGGGFISKRSRYRTPTTTYDTSYDLGLIGSEQVRSGSKRRTSGLSLSPAGRGFTGAAGAAAEVTTRAATTAASAATTAATTAAAASVAVAGAIGAIEENTVQQQQLALQQMASARRTGEETNDLLRQLVTAVHMGGTVEDQVEGIQDAMQMLDLE